MFCTKTSVLFGLKSELFVTILMVFIHITELALNSLGQITESRLSGTRMAKDPRARVPKHSFENDSELGDP